MDKKSVKSIKSGFFSRNFSLARLSAGTAVSLIGKKGSDALLATLKKQANAWVSEMGLMKGPLMKVGQVLTMVDDAIIPSEIKKIFRPLMEQSVELDGQVMAKYLRQRLKKERMDKIEFDLEPYASASIGQVHRAVLRETGEKLVVKIQYPGMQRSLDSDMSTLKSLFTLLRALPGFSKEVAEDLLGEVRRLLEQEMDYHNEAKFIDIYREKFKDHPVVCVPKVYEDLSTKTVITMSYEDGYTLVPERLKDLNKSQAISLARTMVEVFLTEFFEMSMLQTDTHGGNYRLRLVEDAKEDKVELVLLDFGAINTLDSHIVADIKTLVIEAYRFDEEAVKQHLFKMKILSEEDPKPFIDLHMDLVMRSIGALLPASHRANRDGVMRLNSPEWFDYMTDFKKQIFAMRTPPRAINPELVALGRWVIGMRQFLSEIPVDWDEANIPEVVFRFIPELSKIDGVKC